MKVINLVFLLIAFCNLTAVQAQNDCENDVEVPTAICLSSLNINIAATETVTLWPQDIDDGSFDNCSDVTLSFSEDIGSSIEIDANTVSPFSIFLFATDQNGNQSSCWGDVSINGNMQDCSGDTQLPTPFCLTGISVVLEEDQTAVVSASDLDAGSFDNCSSNVTFSFSANTSNHTQTLTTEGTYALQMWVTDSNNNQDFCETFVTVQPFGTALSISGNVRKETGTGISVVEVRAKLNGQTVASTMTDAEGNYTLTGLEDNTTYEIEVNKDTDYLNGVSTFDIVLTQRHIVGIAPLATPFLILAADVNNSGTITTFDLIIMRRLILNIIQTFENVNSWKFFRSTIQFSQNTNPFVLGNVTGNDFTVQLTNNNANGIDFIGLKMGNVNP